MWNVLVSLAMAIATARSTQPLEIQKHKCKNGLEVLVVENRAVPLITVEIAARNGSMTEPPEYNGLSHLYEHMFFKANAVIPNQEAYLARMREQMANASTESLVAMLLGIGAMVAGARSGGSGADIGMAAMTMPFDVRDQFFIEVRKQLNDNKSVSQMATPYDYDGTANEPDMAVAAQKRYPFASEG